MKSYVMDDGRWHHRLRQSWIKTADLCTERARLEHEGQMERVESCAAAVGTAVHTAIEVCLGEYQEGSALALSTTIEVAQDDFTSRMALPEFRWIKYTERTARAMVEACARHWYHEVLPTLPDDAYLETKFVAPFIDDDTRVVELEGMIDYYSPTEGLKDWKTNGGQEYKRWEYERWAVQPTVYSWAALGFPPHIDTVETINPDHVVPFEYVVMSRKGVQRFTVERGWPDWRWLRDKLTALCVLIEGNVSPWPKNDNHALCSAKWCPSWDACKGQHYGKS